jgi:hypothetical protein
MLDLHSVMEELRRLATAVQSEPLTQAQLRERWGNPDERTFQRWLQELRLVPFRGRGESAVYRMAAVLRAEEQGEKRNGGGVS